MSGGDGQLPSAEEWIAAYAAELGVEPPSPEEIEQILDLAGVAAHSSERKAAPVACWIAARAGLDPTEGLERARKVG